MEMKLPILDYLNPQKNKMQKTHKLFSYLPIFIVINWIVCFLFLRNAYFYQENYYKFDLIDSFLVGLSLTHFFFFNKYYFSFSKKYIYCILAIIFLTLIYSILNENVYYFLYISIIVFTVIESIY